MRNSAAEFYIKAQTIEFMLQKKKKKLARGILIASAQLDLGMIEMFI